MNKLLVVWVMLSLVGCSNKAIYDKLQRDERNKCAKEPPSNYFECIERTNKSYEEYERELKEISDSKTDRHEKCPKKV